MELKKIVVAGASGYIGKSLIPKLIEKFPDADIIALSRAKQNSEFEQVTWIPCDLFSLKAIEQAVPNDLDLAFYLVHSMGPTAHLDQGSFADYDLILADNFARAVKKTEIKQLIYLGGLIPENCQLSLHLKSRLEVESVFKSFDLAGCKPITYLEMMSETARKTGKKRTFFRVPLFTPTLSRLWVRLITPFAPFNEFHYPTVRMHHGPLISI